MSLLPPVSSWRVGLAVGVVSLLGCGPTTESEPDGLAASVTIHRDAWGIAHIHGRTDQAAAFGMGYAQAEDHFAQLEENALRAVGRAAEFHGEDRLLDDWLARSLEVPRIAREEYEHYATHEPAVRDLLDGFAAGIEQWVADHPGTERRLEAYEPWYPLAFIRYLYFQRGFLVGGSGLGRGAFEAAFANAVGLDRQQVAGWAPDPTAPSMVQKGSNSWAVTAAKSTSGHPLLLINPHLPFFGPAQVYEAHLISDEGWNISGYTRFGFPLPYVGFNEHLAWASTDNAADLADSYLLTFDDPDDPTSYRWGDERRSVTEWTATIAVKTENGLEERKLPCRKSHHGPIVAEVDGQPVAVRMAKLDQPGWLPEWRNMTRATNLAEFEDAVRPLDMLFGNYLYADRDGHVLYVYNGAVPKRDPDFDWSGPVDGSDPRTEWQGYHTYDELPRVFDPASGWVQNCNGTPFLASAEGDNPDPEAFPPYMVVEGDNGRSRAARRILTGREAFDFDTWTTLAWDGFVTEAAADIEALVGEWSALQGADAARAAAIEPVVAVLRDWDQVASVDSVAASLYVAWGVEIRVAAMDGLDSGPTWRVTQLEKVVEQLTEAWGTWEVPWGDRHRLQRVPGPDGPATSGDFADLAFGDGAPSHAVAGMPSWAGSTFTLWSRVPEGDKRHFAFGGNSYVAVIELGPKVRARTLHAFGQSGDPASEHFFDRAEPFATGDFQDAPVTLEDVEAAAVRSYRPGE